MYGNPFFGNCAYCTSVYFDTHSLKYIIRGHLCSERTWAIFSSPGVKMMDLYASLILLAPGIFCTGRS